MIQDKLFFKPYRHLDNAFLDASDYSKDNNVTVHIIESDIGYEIVPEYFKLSRNYYHSSEGRKIFFTLKETISPK